MGIMTTKQMNEIIEEYSKTGYKFYFYPQHREGKKAVYGYRITKEGSCYNKEFESDSSLCTSLKSWVVGERLRTI